MFFVAFVAISPVALFAQLDQSTASLQLGKGYPKSAEELPSSPFKQLLDKLSPEANARAIKWLQEFEFTGADLQTLRVDSEGGVYFQDTLLPPANAENEADTNAVTTQVPASTLANAFKLHSLPGAPNVVFLDFDGHVFSNTAWGSGSFSALPYDLDGNKNNFSDTERERIVEIWHRVAEDLAPFDIDVTTEEPDGFDRYTGRVLVTRDVDANGKSLPGRGAGGVAYVGVFGASNYHTYFSPALVYFNNLAGGGESYVAEASSHEFGHNLGLSHDGKGGSNPVDYYSGHGSGLVSWAPIMGNSYSKNVTEWSKGEYSNANQKQDDLAIIQGKLGPNPDDHGDTTGAGTNLVVAGNGSVVSSNPELDPDNLLPENKGIINTRNDVDVFTFAAGTGPINLTVTPAWDAFYPGTSRRGANLDIKLELRNSSGSLVKSNDPSTDTQATISTSVSAGTYHLFVSGVGKGNLSSGYSDYASLGQYYINGSITAASGSDITAPNPNPMSWASDPTATGQTSIAMTASVATDETSSVQYNFRCVAGDSACVSSGWQSSTSHTATGLTPGTGYTFNVVARDAALNTTTASPSVTATTDSEPGTSPDIDLTVSVNGRKTKIKVRWSGATGEKVEIYRDGSFHKRTRNDGKWNDKNFTVGNTYIYRVCEKGSTTVCSDEKSVTP